MYELTGLEQDYCPECGGPETVVDMHDEEVLTYGDRRETYVAIDLACGHSISVLKTDRRQDI